MVKAVAMAAVGGGCGRKRKKGEEIRKG